MTSAEERRGRAVEPDLRRFHGALARQRPGQGWFAAVLRLVISLWCRAVRWRLEVSSASLPTTRGLPGGGCVVVATPHRAWLEPFLLHAAWPRGAARLVWLADDRTVTRSWWRRWFLPRIGVLPVGRDVGGPRAYARLASEVLAAGHALVVFPEVGPPSVPDRSRRISPGFAYLALAAEAPIVPVVIGGTHHIVRGSSFSLDILDPVEPGPQMADPFTPDGRVRAAALRDRFAALVGTRLPERNAAMDARAPSRDRWRWLATLFG